MMECLLCMGSNLEICDTIDTCIEVDSQQWHALNVGKLINKHLWPIDNMKSQSCLCSNCWYELNNFHQFYKRIERVHDELKSLLKTEAHDPLEDNVKLENSTIESKSEPEDIKFELIEIEPQCETSIEIKQETENLNTAANNDNLDKSSLKYDETHQEKRSDHHKDNVSDYSGNTDSDDEDLPLVQARRRSLFPSKRKIPDSLASDKKDEVNSNKPISNKSYYQPKTNLREYDTFLKEHFKIDCSICFQPFEYFRALSYHFKKEHNERAYVICCETKFFNRRLLVDHINYHKNPEHFKCLQCGKVFSKRRCLLVHLRSHGDLKHCCKICGKKFAEKSKLDSHNLSHLSEEEKKFPCNECGKLFGNEYVLTHHHRSVHLNIYAKICEICGQTMPDTNSFKRHMEKHDSAAPSFQCADCGLVLSSKLSLKHHRDLKHPIGGSRDYTCHICMKISPNLKALKKHIQCTHEMGYNFKCTVCEKAFKRGDNLKAHMSTHTGTPLYSCPWCPKTFNSNGNMHNHRKKAHPMEWEEARRKKYSGNLPPNFKPPTTSNSHCMST